MSYEHPLVWQRQSDRKTMLIDYIVDSVVGMSQAEGRALLARLLEWTAQPALTYRHHWQVGDLVIWDNTGALHRVVAYAVDSGGRMAPNLGRGGGGSDPKSLNCKSGWGR